MAELNLVFTVLCKHCGSPLYGRVKFCPHCGKEESVTLVAGAANARRALEHGETADEAETQALMDEPPAAAQSHEVQEVAQAPAVLDAAATRPTEQPDSTTAPFAAPTFESQAKELVPLATTLPEPTPTLAPTLAPMPRHHALPKRPMIGKVAAMALLLLALVPGPIHFNKPSEMAKSPELAQNLAQPQGALDRDDRSATQRAIAALVTAYDAGVRMLSAKFDQRMQEQSDRSEQPRSAASREPAKQPEADSALPPPPAPARTPSATEAPATVVALPELSGTAKSKETTCSPALVALALCPDEPMPESGPGGAKP